MRVSMSDQPGALGALASALGRDGVNILTLDIVDHRDGIAVDDLCVETRDEKTLSEGLRRTAEVVPGAVVEAIKPLKTPRTTSPMHLATDIAEATPEKALEDTPWLPLNGPRALAPAPWMPPAWCMGRMSYEIAAAPLSDPHTALLVARKHGPKFRPSEVEQLGLLTRILGTKSHDTLVTV
jgi:hypothetical protein